MITNFEVKEIETEYYNAGTINHNGQKMSFVSIDINVTVGSEVFNFQAGQDLNDFYKLGLYKDGCQFSDDQAQLLCGIFEDEKEIENYVFDNSEFE